MLSGISVPQASHIHSVSVKLDPPFDLHSNVSSGSCVLTWTISPALEPMATLLSYELALKRREEAWEVTLWLVPLGLFSTRAAAVNDEEGRGPEPCVYVHASSPCAQICWCVYVCAHSRV